MAPVHQRRADFDLIRIFACLTILTIHFNASVSGYDYSGTFLFDNGLIPNFYFGCVYLGEIGNSLFFILSGACLARPDSRRPDTPFRFWFKRGKALYPAYWIAWAGATCVHLLCHKGISNAPLKNVVWSFLGVDGYMNARGLASGTFYQVGEWYLGCILLCYLFWPLVAWLWEKLPPAVFGVGAAAVYAAAVLLSDGYDLSVVIRLCEMTAGCFFSRYLSAKKKGKAAALSLSVALLAVCCQGFLHNITVSFAVCWAIFVTLSFAVDSFPALFTAFSAPLKTAADLTYPLFLVHHKLISILAGLFDLTWFPYRYTVTLYVAYLFLSIVTAYWLNRAAKRCVATAGRLWSFCRERHSPSPET